jgi:hypothetical protein
MVVENNKELIEEAKEESLKLLKSLITPKGFVASSNDVDNYKRVFSRDGIIAGIASIKFKDDELKEAFKQTLLTLKRNQDKTGRIASNVSIDEEKISYGTTVGRVDSSIWYVIGCCFYFLETGDKDFLVEVSESVEKTVFYLECLELNGRGLLYIPPGGDWADEYINEGYVLFDQMLYVHALEFYYKVFRISDIQDKINDLKNIIKVNYFPNKDNLKSQYIYQEKLMEKISSKYKTNTPIASFSSFGAKYYYDLFAISLLFNSNLIDNNKKDDINLELESTYGPELPVYPAFYPVIDEKSHNWDKLNSNYLFRFKNKPNEYHNGGLWGVSYGFYLGSLDKLKEEKIIEFAKILKRDAYEFPEFYHGLTFEGLGTKKLGFTAAGYLLAYQNFINKNKPLDI